MKSPIPLLAAALLVSLAACNNNTGPEVVDSNPDPMADQLANKAPVELPPAIKAEKTMRCKDGSLVYLTFLEGDKQVLLRSEKNGAPVRLVTDDPAKPFTAEGGYSLTGAPATITLTQPGKPEQSCKA